MKNRLTSYLTEPLSFPTLNGTRISHDLLDCVSCSRPSPLAWAVAAQDLHQASSRYVSKAIWRFTYCQRWSPPSAVYRFPLAFMREQGGTDA